MYPQQPQYPAYPPPAQQPGYPPPGQYPPPQYTQAPQQYAPPPQAPQAAPLARGTIDDFYDQPTASGKSISFNSKPPGTSYAGYVARTITHADIQQQTDIRRVPLFHPDGRPKFVMIIPLQLQPSAEFPDGRAAWYVKGADKVELERAMEAAGLPPGTVPEEGALITITYTGDRPIPNLNAQKVKAVTYQRPQGSPAASPHQPASISEPNGQPPSQDPPPWQQTPPQQPVPSAYEIATGQPRLTAQQQAPSQSYQQQVPFQPPQSSQQQVPPQPMQPMQPPPGLTPEQQAALAAITGQQG